MVCNTLYHIEENFPRGNLSLFEQGIYMYTVWYRVATLKKKSLLTHTGAPSNVTSPRESLQAQAGWQEIVKDKSPGGYSYDEEQNVLWLRLTVGGLVNITLK